MTTHQDIEEIKRMKGTINGGIIWIDSGLANSLKLVKGIVASYLVQYSDDFYNVEVGSLNEITSKTSVKNSTVSRALSWLTKKGYIDRIDKLSPYDAKGLLCQKIPNDYWDHESSKKCEWCKSTVLRLHGHHYPIPNSKGGKHRVYICPACHDEFHYLVDRMRFKLNPKLLDLRTITDEMMEEIKR